MDPLSVAGSVAGLITLVAATTEISRELCKSSKQKPQLLKRLANELEGFQGVLADLDGRLTENGGNQDEQNALKAVTASCESTMRKLEMHLTSLRGMFAKGIVGRLVSRRRILVMMEELEAMKEDLAAFKLTLGIALHLRAIKQSTELATTADVDRLRMEITELTTQNQRLRPSRPPHPIQQYIDISATALRKKEPDIARSDAVLPQPSSRSVGLSSSATSNANITCSHQSKSAGEDMGNPVSFEGFKEWLDSFSPDRSTVAAEEETVHVSPARNNIFSKHTRVQLHIKNLRRSTNRGHSATGEEKTEMIELAMADYFYAGIDALHQRGYSDVCGFRIGNRLLGPMMNLGECVPVYVTDGPSSYSIDWLEVNKDKPLEEFYNTFIRKKLDISIRDNQLEVKDWRGDTETVISLHRTLRLPEDGVIYNLPALFGHFPLSNVDSLKGKLPDAMFQKTGVVFPMYSREAIAITISSRPHRIPSESLAIRVLSGGINVISGLRADEVTGSRKQDYITAPAQSRLDGFLWDSDGERSVIRQFAGMPTGEGYTAEGQVTGNEVTNGIQLIIAPPFVEGGKFWSDTVTGSAPLEAQEKPPSVLGLNPGARLLMSGKGVASRYRTEQANVADGIFLAPKGTLFHDKSRDSLSGMRPARTHEVLLPILEQCGQPRSLTLEPVFPMTITVKGDLERPSKSSLSFDDRGLAFTTLRLSPFLPMEILYKIVSKEFDFDFADTELFHDGRQVPRDDYMLHQICADGDTIMATEWSIANAGPRLPDDFADYEGKYISPQKSIVSKWEMGLALGGTMYQNIYADTDFKRWDWKNSQLLNIQALNSVAYKSFTGISPPEPPFSFDAYVNAGIPFYHVIPKSSLLSSESVPKLDAVSKIDLRKGPSKGITVHGLKPTECVLCDLMLADTILRPCNHVFCSECIRSKMQTLWRTVCAACGKRSSGQIQFSGPAEVPQQRPVDRRHVNK